MALATTEVAESKKPATWSTYQQWAQSEIRLGGVHSRRWGDASPTLKWISTQMIYMKFGNGWVGKKMLCYAQRESGMNPGALSSGGDRNLFQINYSAHHNTFDFARLDHYDVGYGIIVAYRLSQGGTNFAPWAGGTYPC